MMIDCHITNITFGEAARADYAVNKVSDLSAQIRKPYFDMNKFKMRDDATNAYSDGVYGKNGIKTVRFMEGTFQLHFSDKLKSTSHHVIFTAYTQKYQ
jgi:hypothetical protein